MAEHEVASADELADGDYLVTELEGREVGIFNIDGTLYAYTNWCPHQSGPVCEGYVGGAMDASFDPERLETTTSWEKEGEIITCPWHGWEFDLTSGDCLSRRDRRLLRHEVSVEDGSIVVSL